MTQTKTNTKRDSDKNARHSRDTPRHSREGGTKVQDSTLATRSDPKGKLQEQHVNLKPETINNLITENLDIWTSSIKSKSRTGRGANKTYELYGIKKLRELILDLAVRGLLVPQDPNDEPASVLLEKIKAEKEQLIKAGKIKKQKALPEITEEEKPFELPIGWEFERLGNITSRTGSGSTPRGGKNAYVEEGIPLLRSQNIRNSGLKLFDVAYIPYEIHDKMSNTTVFPNDLLLNITGGSLGRCTIFPSNIGEANVSQHVSVIRLYELIAPKYMHICMLSPYVQKMIWGRQVGMAREGLSKKVMELFEIPVPPSPEQKRIVAKVDELMVLCDQLEQQTETSIEAHKLLVESLLTALTQAKDHKTFQQAWQRIAKNFDTLFTTEHSIDQLKQTILQLAIMGKLVPQNPNDEPASELLKKIAAEKEKLIKEGKIKKQKPLPEITEEERPFELPEVWKFCRLGEIIKISSGDGLTAANMNKEGRVPVYGGNGITGYHDQGNIEHESIVIGRVGYYCGSIHLTPKIAWVTDNAFITRFSESNIYIHFLSWLLKGTNLKENENATAQPVISGKKIYPIVVALPTFREQKRIVNKLEEIIDLCDQMKAQITSYKKTQTKIADTLTKLL